MTDDVRIAVLIPCHNEEMTIAKVVSGAPAMMDGSSIPSSLCRDAIFGQNAIRIASITHRKVAARVEPDQVELNFA